MLSLRNLCPRGVVPFMLTLRQEQIDAFKPKATAQFEDDMLAHLQSFAPKRCDALGEQVVREVIRGGTTRAKKYGFVLRGPVRFYIELMFMFGGYFDTDPQCPWAAAVLKDPKPTEQMARADRLHIELSKYIQAVFGPARKSLIQATKRLSLAKLADFINPQASLDKTIQAKLREIYPEKCEHLGPKPLAALLEIGVQTARDCQLQNQPGIVLTTILAFDLGHRFAADPLCRWIGADLADKNQRDANLRIEKTFSKWKAYLDSLLADLAPGESTT